MRCVLSIARDISDARTAQDEIRHLAFYDPLTELPNRRLLLERLRQTVATGKRSGRRRALLFIDLDNFKNLNDTLGHSVGDLLLKEVGERLSGCIRAVDTAARVGGDEFVVILEDLGGSAEEAASQARSVAEKILATSRSRMCWRDGSAGARRASESRCSGMGMRARARFCSRPTSRCIRPKQRDGRRSASSHPSYRSRSTRGPLWKREVREGIRKREFELWYQPQVERGRVIGAEALLRWNHPRRGVLAPAEFIALAEETGLITDLGGQALEEACRQLGAWGQRAETAALSIAVNVSPRQFRQTDFIEQVLATLGRTGADPHNLEIEITESLLLEDLEETIGIMEALRSRGIRFSLDDFGTGYSSLAYLKRLPLDQVKIDGTFVRDMLSDATSRAIAQAIIWLSRAMKLSLMAEGVETEEQRAMLEELGCVAYQGYLFSPAVPAQDFERLLKTAVALGSEGLRGF